MKISTSLELYSSIHPETVQCESELQTHSIENSFQLLVYCGFHLIKAKQS